MTRRDSESNKNPKKNTYFPTGEPCQRGFLSGPDRQLLASLCIDYQVLKAVSAVDHACLAPNIVPSRSGTHSYPFSLHRWCLGLKMRLQSPINLTDTGLARLSCHYCTAIGLVAALARIRSLGHGWRLYLNNKGSGPFNLYISYKIFPKGTSVYVIAVAYVSDRDSLETILLPLGISERDSYSWAYDDVQPW